MGDREAESALFRMLMPDLRKIARTCFRAERSGHLLQPTALINEAFLRLAQIKRIKWAGRKHFLSLAPRVMRRLIGHARSELARRFLPMKSLPEAVVGGCSASELAVMGALLNKRKAEFPQRCAVAEMKFLLD
jgi:hypothetical protein